MRLCKICGLPHMTRNHDHEVIWTICPSCEQGFWQGSYASLCDMILKTPHLCDTCREREAEKENAHD